MGDGVSRGGLPGAGALILPAAPAWRALGCLLLAGATYRVAPEPEALRTGLALFVLAGGLWMTQAVHLSVTALLVPLLASRHPGLKD